jgi:TadE-like protein
VIILLPLLLLLFGTLDLGLAVLAKTRISFAVEAAAKCGALNMAVCSSASEIAALRGLHRGVAGPRRVGVRRYDGRVWGQRYCNVHLHRYGNAGHGPGLWCLLSCGVISAGLTTQRRVCPRSQ